VQTNPTFTSIYRAWALSVKRWVRLLGTPEADSDDLVQEVFVVVHRRLVAFDGQNIGGWLYTITQRRVRDYMCSAWVRRVRRTGDTSSLAHLSATCVGPDEDFERGQNARRFMELLASVNAEQRLAFELFEIAGLAGHEIAALQKVPINTVWARIYRTRKHLRENGLGKRRRYEPVSI
jgi:RNA polymerase sigma-70 factor, ECF subfamily